MNNTNTKNLIINNNTTNNNCNVIIEDLIEKFKGYKKNIRAYFLDMGRIIWEIKNKEIYKEFGYNNFKDFCIETNYLDMSVSECSKLSLIYQTFRVDYEEDITRLLDVDWTKLYLIARYIKEKEGISDTELDELLDSATELSCTDLTKLISEKKGEIIDENESQNRHTKFKFKNISEMELIYRLNKKIKELFENNNDLWNDLKLDSKDYIIDSIQSFLDRLGMSISEGRGDL